MYRHRVINPGFSWLKLSEAFQIAGGVGALCMPFFGYSTAWIAVHGKKAFKECEDAELANSVVD